MEFFNLQRAVDSEFLRWGFWAPTFFGHAKFEIKKVFQNFFHLQSALDSEIFTGGGVLAPTFFDHVKFEVKKFSELF